jgi:hypothetical protein
MQIYDPTNWYWKLADGTVYSSAKGAVIQATDAAYVKWLSSGYQPTSLAGTTADLVDVLTRANLPTAGA